MAKSGFKIRTKDSGARKLWRRMTMAQPVLRVGVLNPEADQKHKNADVTVGQIAVWMEYGTHATPARSFARDWAIENRDKIIKDMTKAAQDSVLRDKDMEKALAKKGKTYERSMKKRIRAHIKPDNSPHTLRRKRGDTPLIDTRTLLKAIKSTVEQ